MNAENEGVEHKTGQRGTDEAYVKLMALSGDALLKFLTFRKNKCGQARSRDPVGGNPIPKRLASYRGASL